jgi:hypothetical protein
VISSSVSRDDRLPSGERLAMAPAISSSVKNASAAFMTVPNTVYRCTYPFSSSQGILTFPFLG